jgi:F1F0 ATPase subunit 2
MNSSIQMIIAVGCGAVLGVFFFGGLWWTTRHGLRSNAPALWFLGSLLARTVTVLAGFLWIAHGDWRQLLAGLLGFFCVRVLVQCLSSAPRAATSPLTAKATR